MTQHLGTVKPGSTVYVYFDTFAGVTGASVTMSGLAVTDIEIYKNGSPTQRSSDTGYTLLDTDGIDFDSLTGIHGFSIDLSSNADSGFFVAGGRYSVVVSAITVDSQTVSFVAATFDIGYPGAVIDTTIATLSTQTSFTLTAGPAEDDALNGCVVVIHDIASAVQLGYAVIQDYTGSTKTVTLVAGVTFTAAAGDNISVFPPALQPTTWGRTLGLESDGQAHADVKEIEGSDATNQIRDSILSDATRFAGADIAAILTDTGTTLQAEIDGVQADTEDIQSRLPAALTAGGNMKSDALAWAGAATATDDVALKSTLAKGTELTGFNDLDAAGVRGAVGLSSANLDTQLGAIVTDTAEIGTAGAGLTDLGGMSTAMKAQVEAEATDALNAYDPPTRAEATADKNEILARIQGFVLEAGTIGGTGNDTTHVHMNALTYGDDEINNYLLVIYDVSEDEYHARYITDWVNSSKLATVATLPFTPQNSTDGYFLLPFRQDVTGGSGLDAAGVRAAIGMTSANLDSQLGSILADTAEIGTAGAGLTDLGGMSTAMKAQVEAEANDALLAQNLDHLMKSAVDTDFPTTVHLNSVIGHMADAGGSATFDRTTDSLEALQAEHDSTQTALETVDNLVDDLEGRLTSARAGYLDNLSAGAVAQQASVDDLEGRLTAARAGYLDNLSAGAVALEATAQSILADTGTDGVVVAAGSKSGYSLSAAGIQAIWDALTSALTTANSIGKLIVDNLNATISSRSSHSAADVWAAATRTLTAFAHSVTVGTNNDKTGYRLSSTGVDDILDEAITEPASPFTWASATLRNILGWLGAVTKNPRRTTATQDVVRNEADNADIGTAAVSDDLTTLDRGGYN